MFYPVLKGGGHIVSGPAIFSFCSPPPPLPVTNDLSLLLVEQRLSFSTKNENNSELRMVCEMEMVV